MLWRRDRSRFHEEWHPTPAETRHAGLVSLVMALVPCPFLWPVAFVGARDVVRHTDPGRREHGRGPALCAMGLSVVWAAIFLVAMVVVSIDEFTEIRDDTDDPARATRGAAYDLTHGSCLTGEAPEFTDTVQSVGCQDPHRWEVFATLSLPGDSFPGEAEVTATAERRCAERFAGFVGKPYDESSLTVVTLLPTTAEEWNQHSGAVCLVGDGTNRLGSVKDQTLDLDTVLPSPDWDPAG